MHLGLRSDQGRILMVAEQTRVLKSIVFVKWSQ